MSHPNLLVAFLLWGASGAVLIAVAGFAIREHPDRDIIAEGDAPTSPLSVPDSPDAGEMECLALAIYHEARSETGAGMRAVGKVILNRAASSRFPDTICGVVKQGGETPPCQFSWWCDSRSDRPVYSELFYRARVTAFLLMTDEVEDPTDGALFFHADYVTPQWMHTLDETATIGGHVFYKYEGME